jgi:predicted transcriptional regulator
MGKRTTLPVAAAVMELNEIGHSRREIARRTGLSFDTVKNILEGARGWDEIADAPVFAQYRAQQNKALELAYRNLAAMSVIRATELVNDPRTQYHSLVLGSGIAVEQLATQVADNAQVDIHVISKSGQPKPKARAKRKSKQGWHGLPAGPHGNARIPAFTL